MLQIVLFGFVCKDFVINPVTLEIFAMDLESVLAQVVAVTECDIRRNQWNPVLVSVHCSMAAEFRMDARVAFLGAPISLDDVDESTVIGVVVSLSTWVSWICATVCGQEACCCREVSCDLVDLLQIVSIDPCLCMEGFGDGKRHHVVREGLNQFAKMETLNRGQMCTKLWNGLHCR